MPDSTITWNGVSSSTLGLAIEKYPALNRPGRKYTAYDVPGQNGSAYILQDAWSETVQAYEISVKNPVANFKAIAEWLHSADGYAQLSDSYDPDIYRMAVVVDPFDVENSLSRAGRAMIQFRCRPERFQITSDTKVMYSTSITLNNPTNHTAYPLIKIDGLGFPSLLKTNGRTTQTGDAVIQLNQKVPGCGPTSFNIYKGLTAIRPPSSPTHPYIIYDSTTVSSLTATTEGTISVTGTRGIGLDFRCQPNTTYTVTFAYSGSGNTSVQAISVDKNGRFLSFVGDSFTSGSRYLTFTTDYRAYSVILVFGNASTSAARTFSGIMLVLGSTPEYTFTPATQNTTGYFSIGDCQITLSTIYDYMYLDCETMNAYREPGENLNSFVTITDRQDNLTANTPRLLPGNNTITVGANWINDIIITPRFWTL